LTGLLFFRPLFFSLTSLTSLGSLFAERELFVRERAAGLCGTGVWAMAKLATDLLPLLMEPLGSDHRRPMTRNLGTSDREFSDAGILFAALALFLAVGYEGLTRSKV